MKAKYFQTYDPIYHKKVKAVNIILTPEEKELFEKGLNEMSDNMETGEKLKKFLRIYTPYEPENENKEFPNGAYNTVIFEDMFLNTFMDLISIISYSGIMRETILLLETIKGTMEEHIEIINETNSKKEERIDALKQTISIQREHIEALEENLRIYETLFALQGRKDDRLS